MVEQPPTGGRNSRRLRAQKHEGDLVAQAAFRGSRMVRGGLFAPIGRLPNTNRSSIPRSSLTDFNRRVIALGRCSHRARRDSRRPSPRKSVGMLSATSFGRPAFRPVRSRLSTLHTVDPSRLCFGWMSLSRKRACLSRPLSPPGTARRSIRPQLERALVFRLRSAPPS
jgi:hypothetical protein